MVHDSFSASRHDPGMKCFSVCLFVCLSLYLSVFFIIVCMSVGLFLCSWICLFICFPDCLLVHFCLFINLLFGWFVHFIKNISDDTFHHLDRNPNVHIFAINPGQKTSMDLHLCESHQQSRHPFHLRHHS